MVHCTRVSLFSCLLTIASITGLSSTESILGQCQTAEGIYNCSGIGLEDIPTGIHIPTPTTIIDLHGNHISNITYLDYGSLTALDTLDLSDNQISILEPNAFMKLKGLKVLDLSKNYLQGSGMEEHMFMDLRKLKELRLKRNPLKILRTYLLNYFELPSLQILDLSYCELETLEASSIDLPSLISLNLSWNKLTEINRRALRMLNDLKTLDMSHNLIKVFDTVPHLPELQTWYLDSNLIETVHVGDHIWTYAESLQNLYMRNNQIMRFGPGDLPLDLGTLKVLDLSNNEIHCDCRMKWIASAVVEDKANRDIVLKCRYLSRVNGKDLLSLPEEELNCNIPPGKIIFIVSMAAIIAVCIGLVAFFVVRSIRRRLKIRRATKSDNKGDYSAVYTKEDEDIQVTMSDSRGLLVNKSEFDV